MTSQEITAEYPAIESRKIITSFISPPIPIRSFDWCAWFDGEEQGVLRGWGKTKAEAVQNLKFNASP